MHRKFVCLHNNIFLLNVCAHLAEIQCSIITVSILIICPLARASVESQDDPNYMSLRTLQRPPIIVEQDQPEPDPVLNTTSSQQPQRMAMPTNWSRGAQ